MLTNAMPASGRLPTCNKTSPVTGYGKKPWATASAVRRKAGTSPQTLVTTDVAELRATLAKSPPTRQAGEQVAGYDGAVTERAEGSRHAGASGSSGRTGTSP